MLWQSGTAEVHLLRRMAHFHETARTIEDILSNDSEGNVTAAKELISHLKQLKLDFPEHTAKVCLQD